MVRLTLSLVAAAVSASGCQSYTSSQTGADLITIAVKSVDEASIDCGVPHTTFESSGAAVPAGSRLTAVAIVYRKELPRRPHSVIGTVRTSVRRDSPCPTDLIAEVRGRAVVEGCDAVVVGEEMSAAGGRTALEGVCLAFSR
jgi:hypothetical protein